MYTQCVQRVLKGPRAESPAVREATVRVTAPLPPLKDLARPCGPATVSLSPFEYLAYHTQEQANAV